MDEGALASEGLLSAELLAELGEDALLVPGEKKRKFEIIEEQPKVSKQQKRKLDSLLKRKDREDKRDSYLGILAKHQISTEQRQLMLSTRSIGQKMNTKAQLKMLFNKYKAGLELTPEEHELLFPERSTVRTQAEYDELFASAQIEVTSEDAAAVTETPSVEEDAPLIDLRAVFSEAPPKKSMKSTESIGAKMLKQFESLKAKQTPAAEQATFIAEPSTSAATMRYESAPKYIPAPIYVPITFQGVVPRDKAPSATVTASGTVDGRIGSVGHSWMRVDRNPAIQAARMNLPVCGMEQEIVEAVYNNDVVILCGETGSGKSTQVPQFLYEAGYGNEGYIAVTQPRRVAATSTAERVAVEMGQHDKPRDDRLVG